MIDLSRKCILFVFRSGSDFGWLTWLVDWFGNEILRNINRTIALWMMSFQFFRICVRALVWVIMMMIACLLCAVMCCDAVVLCDQVVIGSYRAIEEVVEHFLGRFSACIGCLGHRRYRGLG